MAEQFPDRTLSKEERLHVRSDISALLGHGHWGVQGVLKYCWIPRSEEPVRRIMVSVPKKHFKRAVKRNLLKRRIRESFRLQKQSLEGGADILFVYNSAQIVPFDQLHTDVGTVLASVSEALRRESEKAVAE